MPRCQPDMKGVPEMPLVISQLEELIGTITLNHPARLNAISAELVVDVIAALDELERDGARAIVLRALPGCKVWSAGHNIHELPDGRRDPLGYHDPLEQLLRYVQDCPVPVIAMIEGGVWGGATDLCISCDMIICATNATFAITPAKLGLPYNASGLVHFLNVLGPHKARELFFTAMPMDAEAALLVGMVNHVVPPDELESLTYSLAAAIAQNAPLAVRALKQQFRLLLGGQTLPAETFERIQGIRRVVYDSADYAEGIIAFKEKRRPHFQGN